MKRRRRRSYYLPEEIQRKILLRLPVKSLIRFRSVDRRLRRLISTQQFIMDHIKTVLCEEDELIIFRLGRSNKLSCCLFLDGLVPTHKEDISLSNETLNYFYVVGYCNGIACLICHRYMSTCEVQFLNPSIRKVVAIPAPDHLSREISSSTFGFGYVEDDYKLVVLPLASKSGASSFNAKVFSLKARNWETVACSWSRPQDPQLRYWTIDSKNPVFVDGACHWLAEEGDVNGRSTRFVLSFYLSGDHRIGKIVLPRFLSNSIHVYDGRLCVIVFGCEVWVLNKCGSTWTRIIERMNLKGPETGQPYKIVGFSGGGDVVYSQKCWLDNSTCEELLCYNPMTKRKRILKKNHGYGMLSADRLYAYKKNLVLLDQDIQVPGEVS